MQSSLIINGCANNLTSITVEITSEELDYLYWYRYEHNLVTYSSDPSCSDLSSVIVVTSTGHKCSIVATKTSISSGQLSVVHRRTYCTGDVLAIIISVPFGTLALCLFIWLLCFILSKKHGPQPAQPPQPADEAALDQELTPMPVE